MNTEETGGQQKITSGYNKLRTEEYGQLRERFYKRFPKCLESDYTFEQEIFLHYDILQSENKRLRETLIEVEFRLTKLLLGGSPTPEDVNHCAEPITQALKETK